MARPVRFSYSSWKLFEQCKRAWKHRYIENLPDKIGPAANRGSRVHLAGERYLKGEIPAESLPIEYKSFLETMQLMKTLGAKSETVWMVDHSWNPVDNEMNAWLKAVIDVHYLMGTELHLIDLKTGRFNKRYDAQLEFYAVMAASVTMAESVHVRCFYLDERSVGNEATYKREWLLALRGPWEERFIQLTMEELFFATPNYGCKFCAYAQSKGGPCDMEMKP